MVLEKAVDVRLAGKRLVDMAFMLEKQFKQGENDFELFGTLNAILRLQNELAEEIELLSQAMDGGDE